MRIAVTGHRDLRGRTAELTATALRERIAAIAGRAPLVGITCLADGADTMFADAVLDAGGAIEVVIPAEEYRAGLPEAHHPDYDRLLERAAVTTALDFKESTSESHMSASEAMLETAHHLIAVWDGRPARGFGGTADVVAEARRRGVPVTIIWPEGAERS